ncbi:MAG: SCO family protein [Gallionellaceae bacterium]|jgi:cytochrome oxidase Cu insertion factor (SCO1/SenC/PrrC family)
MQSNNETIIKSNRHKLVIVLMLFFVPSLVATLLYYSGWRPVKTVNHGELIVPPRPLEDSTMQSLDGKTVKLSEFRGKWLMVYFDTSNCSVECTKQLFFMRQIHLSQGKNLDKIQRLFVLTDSTAVESLKPKLTDYPNMLVLKAEESSMSKLLKEFDMDVQHGVEQRNIYFVDPLGNLMMRYQPGVEPAGMRKDLERLLKYSTGS